MITKTLIVFCLIHLPSLALACVERQFQSSYIGGCVDCPEDPNINCQFEGEDAEACQLQCSPESSQKDEGNTTEKSGYDRGSSQKNSDSNKEDEGTGEKPKDITVTQSNQTSNRNNVIIPAGIAVAVSALALILGLAVYFFKRTRQQGHPVENEHTENENGETNERRYRAPEIVPDLNKTSNESIASLLETTV